MTIIAVVGDLNLQFVKLQKLFGFGWKKKRRSSFLQRHYDDVANNRMHFDLLGAHLKYALI